MPEDIGQLAIVLEADGDPMIAGAQDAARTAAGAIEGAMGGTGAAGAAAAGAAAGAAEVAVAPIVTTFGAFANTVTRIAAGIAVTAGAFLTLRAGVMAAADEIGRMVDLSNELNTSFDALASLQLAAEDSGVGVETLTSSLRILQRNIGNAARGSGEAREAFSRLNLSAEELSGMGTDQALARVADALGEVVNASERASLIQRLLGRGGQQLAVLLQEGSDAFQQADLRAEAFGLHLGDSAGAVEEMGDAIGHLSMLSRGVFFQLAGMVAPLVRDWAAAWADMGTAGMSILRGVFRMGRELLEPFRAFFVLSRQGWERIRPLAEAVRKSFEEVGQTVKDAFDTAAIDAFNEALRDMNSLLGDSVSLAGVIDGLFGGMTRGVTHFIMGLEGFFKVLFEAILRVTDLAAQSLARLIRQVEQLTNNPIIQYLTGVTSGVAGLQLVGMGELTSLNDIATALERGGKHARNIANQLWRARDAASEIVQGKPLEDMAAEAERMLELLRQTQQAREPPAAEFGSQAALEIGSQFSAQNQRRDEDILSVLQQQVEAERRAQQVREQTLTTIRQWLQQGTLQPRPAPV